MNALVTWLNSAGMSLVQFSGAMLIQSGALIILLLGLDRLIHRRARAIVRYGIWTLACSTIRCSGR